MEATMKVRRLRDLYAKTAKRHARRYAKFEGEDSPRGKDARERAANLERYAQELGLKPSQPYGEVLDDALVRTFSEPAEMKGDYPQWTHYSHGNPLSERRNYRGFLLYAFGDYGNGCGWMETTGPLHPADSIEDAKRQAEAWADEAAGFTPGKGN